LATGKDSIIVKLKEILDETYFDILKCACFNILCSFLNCIHRLHLFVDRNKIMKQISMWNYITYQAVCVIGALKSSISH